MKTRKGLGKGLAALISEAEAPEEIGAHVSEIDVMLIDPNPYQPRQIFDDDSLEELKQSILSQGLLQPVLVRPHGDHFQLIVGERRWRAAKAAGLEQIPALVREVTRDEDMLELALLENVQRQDLNPIELAQALLKFQTSYALTQEVVAEKLGVSRAHVANTLRLLKLAPPIQEALSAGKITTGHARALLSVEDPAIRDDLFQRFLVEGRPSVREAEDLTRRTKPKMKTKAPVSESDHRQSLELAKIEDRLRRLLLTRVRIKTRSHGGIVEILFYTHEDLQRLLDLLEK
jgi:ParB family transcriptional regulator, chromosome partitioning protein